MSRIVRLSNYALPHRGGVEVSIQNTGRELVNMGHEVTIICYRPTSNGPEKETIEGVRYIRRPPNVTVAEVLKSFPDTQRQIDLLSYEDFPAYERGQLKKIAQAEHDLYYSHGWEGVFPPNPDVISTRRAVATAVDYNIHVGDFISTWYHYRADFVSYGGTNLLVGHPAYKHNLRVISWVGRLEKDTGFQQALEAMLLILKENPGVKLEIFGDGLLKTMIPTDNMAIDWRGFVPDPMLHATGKVVLCSGYLSILEALVHQRLPISFFEHPLKEDYLRPFSSAIYAAGDRQTYKNLLDKAINLELSLKAEAASQLVSQHTWRSTAEVMAEMAEGKYATDKS